MHALHLTLELKLQICLHTENVLGAWSNFVTDLLKHLFISFYHTTFPIYQHKKENNALLH